MSTTIHPSAIVDKKAQLGTNVSVGAYSIIGPNVQIGDNTKIHSHVIIDNLTEIGSNNEFFPFCSIGSIPQDLKYKLGDPTKLIIGSNNTFREHVTINPGTLTDKGLTQVGNHCLFMVNAHIAHDCIIEDHVIMANNATLAGHVTVGSYAIIGGLSAIHQFARIGEHAMIGGCSGVESDVIPFGTVKGERAHLCGLNLVGLRRRGFDRDTIFDLRKAYKLLFDEEGTIDERLFNTESMFGDNKLVMSVIDFIKKDAQRTLLTTKHGAFHSD